MDEILDEKTYETRNINYATFMQRLLAFTVDFCLLTMFYFLIKLGLGAQFVENWYLVTVVVVAYFILFASSELQATIGMHVLNIRYVKDNKRNIGFKEAAIHFWVSLVLFPGMFSLLSSLQPTFADKVAKVLVINVK